ncbi:Na+/H+ antiporter NhaC family protein [Bifidobacterium avesanii]|uniref:Na+/H+ antiporter NhaC family protein n=1 Tax=Bifidobacterium avesanii TaxID=1798157 RepID=UPI001384B452|nr:Na+/H+ antiporter NhaC family protein [Bifidobacterium avesanii]KAB8291481.1 sodium:proton antiporter [Bifidobacterium avesanii]
MLETATMVVFCAALFASVAVGWSIVPALVGGLALFFGYGLLTGHAAKPMAVRALRSVKDAGIILVTFALIGVLTSLWRIGGTVAFVIVHAVPAAHAATVVPLSFLLCAGMSALIGSSFASAATMGTMCMALGQAMGTNGMLLGGAVLAGVYVGDRCSPVSTSALLVKQLTHTNLFGNLGRMLRTGLIPFVLSCLIYAVAAWPGVGPFGADGEAGTVSDGGTSANVVGMLNGSFDLRWPVVVPALLVIALAIARIDVRVTMLTSILASVAVCIGVQRTGWRDLLATVVFGYAAPDPSVGALLNGGGVLSMVTVGAIVCISSAYAGIFAQTGMLGGLQRGIEGIGLRAGTYAATLVTATATAMVACNQTLTIMLTHQLCGGVYRGSGSGSSRNGSPNAVPGDESAADPGFGTRADKTGIDGTEADGTGKTATDKKSARPGMKPNEQQAIDMEDSAVVVPALVPWSIAGAVPLSIIGAPTASMAAACFLYLLPVCRLVGAAAEGFRRRRREENPSGRRHGRGGNHAGAGYATA